MNELKRRWASIGTDNDIEIPKLNISPSRSPSIKNHTSIERASALKKMRESVDLLNNKQEKKPYFVLSKPSREPHSNLILKRKATTGTPLIKAKLVLAPKKIEPPQKLSPRELRDRFLHAAKNVKYIVIKSDVPLLLKLLDSALGRRAESCSNSLTQLITDCGQFEDRTRIAVQFSSSHGLIPFSSNFLPKINMEFVFAKQLGFCANLKIENATKEGFDPKHSYSIVHGVDFKQKHGCDMVVISHKDRSFFDLFVSLTLI